MATGTEWVGLREAEIVNIPFLGALAGCSARRSERRVASHTSEEQRRNAPGSAAKNGILAFSASLSGPTFNCSFHIREPDRCRDLHATRRAQTAFRQLHGSKRGTSRARGADGASLGSERILSVLQCPVAAPEDSVHPQDPSELRQAPRACFLPTTSQRSQSAPQRAA